MKRDPPKIICLDLGGVVVQTCRSWAEGCAVAGVPHRESFDDPGNPTAALRLAAVDRYQRGLTEYDAFLEEISLIFGGAYSAQEVRRVHDGWILGDYPGIFNLLMELRRIGLRVACLSNTNDSHWRQMEATSRAFGAIGIRHASHLLGLNKPNPAIYAAFESATGCTADEIFFADDLIENVKGASDRGWQTVHIDHAGDPARQIADALVGRGVILDLPIVIVEEMPSPLVSRTLCTGDSLGGTIKTRPSDFLVDELPLYDPSGEGEHLYLGIQKQDMTHDEMIRIISDHYKVDPSSIGTAGRKDRCAVTRQTLSVNLLAKDFRPEPQHDRLAVLWSRRHGNKLRTGHLAGNRFAIRVRDIDPLRVMIIHRRLRQLIASGVPNAFGQQRFGRRLDNHRLGRFVLEENWDGIIRQLTCTTRPDFPEHQRAAREMCDKGEWSLSIPLWGAGDHAERRMALARSRGWTSSRSVKSLGGATLRFWVNALQSAIFNRVLDNRLLAHAEGRAVFGSIQLGDVASRHADGACFVVNDAECIETLSKRAEQFEISPTGPLFGERMLATTNSVMEIESEAARAFGVSPELFSRSTHPPSGERRPLRIAIGNASTDSGTDEFGGYIRVAFDLPAGAFATIVFKELFGEARENDSADD